MPEPQRTTRETVEMCLFGHYLRTGERFDLDACVEVFERKFNPYHDEIGRFTSPTGAVSSIGLPSGRPAPARQNRTDQVPPITSSNRDAATPARPPRSPRRFRSAFMLKESPDVATPVVSFFDLRRRQAYLDHLRRKAGPNPSPLIKADLDEYQNRLNAARTVLRERAKIADREVNELLRMGLPPLDIAEGVINIARSEAELRDYIAVAGAIPIAGVVGKVGKVGTIGQESIPLVHIGKQGKHIVGHNSFRPGKSVLIADPQVLAKRSGTGVPVNSVPRGQAGYKERVDFGEVIGEYVSNGKSSPTTNGIIVYDKTGKIHIYPVRPN